MKKRILYVLTVMLVGVFTLTGCTVSTSSGLSTVEANTKYIAEKMETSEENAKVFAEALDSLGAEKITTSTYIVKNGNGKYTFGAKGKKYIFELTDGYIQNIKDKDGNILYDFTVEGDIEDSINDLATDVIDEQKEVVTESPTEESTEDFKLKESDLIESEETDSVEKVETASTDDLIDLGFSLTYKDKEIKNFKQFYDATIEDGFEYDTQFMTAEIPKYRQEIMIFGATDNNNINWAEVSSVECNNAYNDATNSIPLKVEGITFGDSIDKVEELLGEPSYTYLSEDSDYLSYTYELTDMASITFVFLEKLDKVSNINIRDYSNAWK